MARKMLVGWRRIADALDVVERTAHKYAVRADDPLPVHNLNRNQVAVWEDDLLAWAARHRLGNVRKDRPMIRKDAA